MQYLCLYAPSLFHFEMHYAWKKLGKNWNQFVACSVIAKLERQFSISMSASSVWVDHINSRRVFSSFHRWHNWNVFETVNNEAETKLAHTQKMVTKRKFYWHNRLKSREKTESTKAKFKKERLIHLAQRKLSALCFITCNRNRSDPTVSRVNLLSIFSFVFFPPYFPSFFSTVDPLALSKSKHRWSSKLKIQLRDELADKYYLCGKFCPQCVGIRALFLRFSVFLSGTSVDFGESNSIVHMQFVLLFWLYYLCHAHGAQSKFTSERPPSRISISHRILLGSIQRCGANEMVIKRHRLYKYAI